MEMIMLFKSTLLNRSIKLALLSISTMAVTHTQASEITVLETIESMAEQESAYKVKNSTSATKFNLALKETPQAVSIVTSQQMQDQNLDTLGDVLAQTVGVSGTQYAAPGTDDTFNNYFARGFSITNYQVDGINSTSAAIGNTTSLNTNVYENVTVLKGANGLLSGTGNPSATINLVRKKPTKELHSDARIELGSWNKVRSEVDVSGSLNQDQSLRARVVASYEDYDSYQKRGTGKQAGIYAIVEADLDESTTLHAGIDAYQKENDGVTAHGFNILDISKTKRTPFGPKDNHAAAWSYDDVQRINVFAGIEHIFNNDWKTSLNTGYTWSDKDIVYGIAGRSNINLAADTMAFSADRNTRTPEQWNIDASAQGPFQLFGRTHEAVLGITAYDMERHDDDWKIEGVPSTVPVSTWDGTVAAPIITASGTLEEKQRQISSYGALRLNPMDHLHVILGASVNNYQNKGNITSATNENGEFVPYAGIVYDLTPAWSVYGSYTNIFKPQSSRAYDGATLDSVTGDTFELGVKADLLQERLNLSLSAFKTKQENVAVRAGEYTQQDLDQGLIPPDLSIDDAYYRAAQGVESEGIELEVGGELLPNWRIAGGYSYVNTEDKSVRINTNIPQNQLKLFTSYQFSGALEKLSLGAGVKWQSDIYASVADRNTYKQDAYTLVDLMGRYQATENIILGLNISNLTDEEYLVGTMARSNVWGAPRTVTGSVQFKY